MENLNGELTPSEERIYTALKSEFTKRSEKVLILKTGGCGVPDFLVVMFEPLGAALYESKFANDTLRESQIKCDAYIKATLLALGVPDRELRRRVVHHTYAEERPKFYDIEEFRSLVRPHVRIPKKELQREVDARIARANRAVAESQKEIKEQQLVAVQYRVGFSYGAIRSVCKNEWPAALPASTEMYDRVALAAEITAADRKVLMPNQRERY